MPINISYFGMLAEATSIANEQLEVTAPLNVAALRGLVLERHSGLANLNFQVAVNQSLSQEHVFIYPGDEIAFLPPFAGG